MMKLFELPFGSTLYQTRTENSDLDLKAIYLPTAKEIVLGKYKKTISTQRPKQNGERNTKDDVDIEVFSLDQYLKLLAQGQTVALDTLFGVKEDMLTNWYSSVIWKEIQQNKDKLLCKDLTAFIGYSKQQAAKYGLKGFRVAALRETLEFLDNQPLTLRLNELQYLNSFVFENTYEIPALPKNENIKLVKKLNKFHQQEEFLEVNGKFYSTNCTVKMVRDQIQKNFEVYGKRSLMAETNQGVDWKAVSHAVRVNSEGIELLETGSITFPRQDRELLIKIKTGQMEYKEVADLIVKGLEDLNAAAAKSTLRDKPDQEWIDNFVEGVYTDIVCKNHKIFENWNNMEGYNANCD